MLLNDTGTLESPLAAFGREVSHGWDPSAAAFLGFFKL